MAYHITAEPYRPERHPRLYLTALCAEPEHRRGELATEHGTDPAGALLFAPGDADMVDSNPDGAARCHQRLRPADVQRRFRITLVLFTHRPSAKPKSPTPSAYCTEPAP